MRYEIKPGRERKSINFIDNIVYSRQKDLQGNDMELKMSIMLQNGNSEMRLASGRDDEGDDRTPKPAILWVPGGGYRGCDKNLMVAEMAFLADAGYVVASMYYRSSAEGHFPDQIIDVKTAVRFLRAHADEYEIDPDHIGIIGRSAGGHLSALAAVNCDRYDTEEWSGYSSRVQACCDLFGPVDFVKLMESDDYNMKHDPNFRWKTVEETHAGAVLGGDPETMKDRCKEFCPPYILTEDLCPIQILHGDCDKLVPSEISEDFYRKIVEEGMEDRADLYILKGAGHGTKEFFQPEVKKLIREFFDKHLKA
ncbi:MAG: alpha/beta hydrolase [Lachnospiraceae bacterium]|nr:alpha/beta hydrolase [Lachnospiraceae bacterium]